jgi:hypothetical protein
MNTFIYGFVGLLSFLLVWCVPVLEVFVHVGAAEHCLAVGHHDYTTKKKKPWPQSASELYRPSERRLSAKLVPTFLADRGCHVVSVTNPYSRIPDFLDRSRYYFFQVAPQLYSRG